jgi:LysM repeat protein
MAVYVVRPVDTLGGIAKRHDTTVKQIQALNRQITNPNVISIGMALNLPGDRPVPRSNMVTGEAPWYQIALEELAHGVVEVEGPEHNPRIIEYRRARCGRRTTRLPGARPSSTGA